MFIFRIHQQGEKKELASSPVNMLFFRMLSVGCLLKLALTSAVETVSENAACNYSVNDVVTLSGLLGNNQDLNGKNAVVVETFPHSSDYLVRTGKGRSVYVNCANLQAETCEICCEDIPKKALHADATSGVIHGVCGDCLRGQLAAYNQNCPHCRHPLDTDIVDAILCDVSEEQMPMEPMSIENMRIESTQPFPQREEELLMPLRGQEIRVRKDDVWSRYQANHKWQVILLCAAALIISIFVICIVRCSKRREMIEVDHDTIQVIEETTDNQGNGVTEVWRLSV